MASTSLSSVTTSISVPNITSLVTLRYVEWLQLSPLVQTNAPIWRFIDGSLPPPDEYLPAVDGKPAERNPEHLAWQRTDQSLVSLLTATLSESILAMLVGCNTTSETLHCLEHHFSQQSIANATHIRFQLMDIKKGTKSVSEYLQHAKSLANSLASLNEHDPTPIWCLQSYAGLDQTMLWLLQQY